MRLCYCYAMETRGRQMLEEILRRLPECRDVRIHCRRFPRHFPAVSTGGFGTELFGPAIAAIAASERRIQKLHIYGFPMCVLEQHSEHLPNVAEYSYNVDKGCDMAPLFSDFSRLVVPRSEGLQCFQFHGRRHPPSSILSRDACNLAGITRLSLSNDFMPSSSHFQESIEAMLALESARLETFIYYGPDGLDEIFGALCKHEQLADLELRGVWSTTTSKLFFTRDEWRYVAPLVLQLAILGKKPERLPPASDFEYSQDTMEPGGHNIQLGLSGWVEDF